MQKNSGHQAIILQSLHSRAYCIAN